MEVKAALVFLIGCASAAPAPVEPAPPSPPVTASAPPTPSEQPTQVAVDGDPCDGGDVAGESVASLGNASGAGAGAGAGGGLARDSGRGTNQTSVPIVKVTVLSVSTGIDSAIVRRMLFRSQRRFVYCYDKALQPRPDLVGSVDVAYVIDSKGAATKVDIAHGLDNNLDTCVRTAMSAIEYPKPTEEVTVKVRLRYSMSN